MDVRLTLRSGVDLVLRDVADPPDFGALAARLANGHQGTLRGVCVDDGQPAVVRFADVAAARPFSEADRRLPPPALHNMFETKEASRGDA